MNKLLQIVSVLEEWLVKHVKCHSKQVASFSSTAAPEAPTRYFEFERCIAVVSELQQKDVRWCEGWWISRPFLYILFWQLHQYTCIGSCFKSASVHKSATLWPRQKWFTKTVKHNRDFLGFWRSYLHVNPNPSKSYFIYSHKKGTKSYTYYSLLY